MRPIAKSLRIKFLACTAFVALAAGAVHVQSQKPTFRSGVDVVVIDVNVVDTKGRPVKDLTPDDFTITVDRKPRQVFSVHYIDHGVRLAIEGDKGAKGKQSNAAASVLDALSASPRREQEGRNVLIVVDDESMASVSGLEVSKAARAFLEKLPVTDRVAVTTIPKLQGSLMFSTDRSVARKILQSLTTTLPQYSNGQFRIRLHEAQDVERHDQDVIASLVSRECRCNYTGTGGSSTSVGFDPGATVRNGSGVRSCTDTDQISCISPLLMQAHQMALDSKLHSQRSLDALRELADGLRQIEGPKTLVLVSGGLADPETTSSYNPLEPALSAGQVSLYTLYIEQSSYSATNNSGLPPDGRDDTMMRFGIENATSAVGGTLLTTVGDLNAEFDRVAIEMSGSYQIGVEVETSDRDGKPHDVQVKVNRRDVEVRSRRRYLIEPEKTGTKNAQPSQPETMPRRVRVQPAEPPLADASAMTPELMATMGRASQYVLGVENTLGGVASDEQYDQVLSKWKSAQVIESGKPTTREDWFIDKRRHLVSEYVLVRAQVPTGWLSFRDVLQSDGTAVRPRPGRLAKLFSSAPDAALAQAQQVASESAKFNIGFGQRNMDAPTMALALLDPVHRTRFYFRKEDEGAIDGVHVWQVYYREIASPTLFVGIGNRDFPLEGTLWIQPENGRVVKSLLRLRMDDVDAEISVAYRPSEELGGQWVPAEMHETYTSETLKLDCVAKYTNYRVIGKQ